MRNASEGEADVNESVELIVMNDTHVRIIFMLGCSTTVVVVVVDVNSIYQESSVEDLVLQCNPPPHHL